MFARTPALAALFALLTLVHSLPSPVAAAVGDPIGSVVKFGQGGVNNHDPYFEDIDSNYSSARLVGGNLVVAWRARNNNAATPISPDGDNYGAYFKIISPTGTTVAGPTAPYLDINASGTGRQNSPLVAGLTGGGFALTWNSDGGPGDTPAGAPAFRGDTYVRVYSATGTAIGGTIRVNANDPTGTEDGQTPEAIVALPDGGFAIVWRDENDFTGNTDDYYLRAFNANGTARGASMQLGGSGQNNFFNRLGLGRGGLAALSNGHIVACWSADDGDSTLNGSIAAGGDKDESTFFQIFDSNGAALTAAIRPYTSINSDGTGNQGNPILAPLNAGGFAIIWNSVAGPGDIFVDSFGFGGDTYVGVFNNSGTLVGSVTKVNDLRNDNSETPAAVQPLSDGGFAVVWRADEDAPLLNQDDYFVRAYNANGTARNPSIKIGGAPTEALFEDLDQTDGLISLSDGGFAVGIRVRDSNNDGTGTSVDGGGYAAGVRVFNADGTARTALFFPYLDINADGSGSQNTPVLAPIAGGGFAVAWNSAKNSNDSGNSDQGNGFNNTSGGDCWTRIYNNSGTALHGTVRCHPSGSGELTGSIDQQDPSGIVGLSGGDYAVIVRDDNQATDNKDDYYVSLFSGVAPAPSNVAPVLNGIGNRTGSEGTLLSFTATATDSDVPAQTLTFTLDATSTGKGMSITSGGAFSWTPGETQQGAHTVTITVTDNGSPNLNDSETFTITISEVNSPPVLTTIGNRSVNEGQTLSFTATATDPDVPANTLSFTLDATSTGKGMTLTSGGAFSWTPGESQHGSHTVTVTVTDNGSPTQSDFETFTITVNEVNSEPVLAAIGNRSVNEQATLSFSVSATDSDIPAQTISYTLDATSVFKGMTLNSGSGAFAWTPSEAQSGAHTVTITATDNGSPAQSDSETFTITVNEINVEPVLAAIGNRSGSEGSALTFTAMATDSDLPANALTFHLDATSTGKGMSITASSGAFTWTPSETQHGTHTVTVTVQDNAATNPLTDSETFTITIAEVNEPPVLAAIGPRSVNEGAPLTFTNTTTDVDVPANSLTYALDATSTGKGMSLDAATGVFLWTPNETQHGSHSVTVTVTDNGSTPLSDSETFTITVNEVNSPPVLGAIGNRTINETATLTFTNTATDPDLPANTLTFSLDATSLGKGMAMNAGSGVFAWTPTEAQSGSHTVVVTVTDNGSPNQSDSETFTITVSEVNTSPVLGSIGNRTGAEGSPLSFSASATDADVPANGLSYALDATSVGKGMSINAGSGAFSWTPSESQDGAHSVTVTVTDDGAPALTDNETFTITIDEVNVAPVLAAIANRAINEGSTVTFTNTATDADLPANSLTYSLDATSLGKGMILDSNSGVFSWTPTDAQDGSHTVTVTVTDNGSPALSDSEAFTITVDEFNVAPVLAAIGNQTVSEGAVLTLTNAATDADVPANALTFSLDATSLGAGMTVNPTNGLFVWTPTENQDGDHTVTVTVTDDGVPAATDSETFTITVGEVNLAPVLTSIGNQTVDESSLLMFTNAAVDGDVPANGLTFSLDATSLAAGMSLGASNGVFSWTPAEAQSGAHTVTVTVTDSGTPNQSDSETFTVTVAEINEAPQLPAAGDVAIGEMQTLELDVAATDGDIPANTVSYAVDATAGAAGVTIDSSGLLRWTPTASQIGVQPVTVTATDNGSPALDDTVSFDITVTNRPPAIVAIAAPDVGQSNAFATSYSFTVSYADPGGIDAASVGPEDVTLAGANGPLTVTSATSAAGTSGVLVVTYDATPPGGSWDGSDNGTVTIALVTNQVADVNGAFVPGVDPLATFDVAVNTAPEIQVSGAGQIIVSGDTTPDPADNTDFGTAGVDGGASVRQFTVENLGVGTLVLTGSPAIEISGANAADFAVTVAPGTNLGSGMSTPFEITFDPSGTGTRQASVTVANSDTDESLFTFAIAGVGLSSGGTGTNTQGGVFDFNGDGTSDIVWRQGRDLGFYYMDGSRYLSNSGALLTLEPSEKFVGVANLDNDGLDFVFQQRRAVGAVVLSSTNEPQLVKLFDLPRGWRARGTAELGGGPTRDVFIQRGLSVQAVILNGTQAVDQVRLRNSYPTVGAGQYDGLFNEDWFKRTGRRVRVRLSDATGDFPPPWRLVWRLNRGEQAAAFARYTAASNRVDMVVEHRPSGTVRLVENDGTAFVEGPILLTNAPGVRIVGPR